MDFISIMELVGTVAFAVSGAVVAIQKQLDYYGIAFLAIITAVGGGIVRDMMINLDLPVALANPIYVIISIASAIVVILAYKEIVKYSNLLMMTDAIGLAAFTAIGAETALLHDVYTPFVVITLAVLTGTGGGILRDVFAREIPFVFRKEIYAAASIIGAIVFMIAYAYTDIKTASYICFGVTLVIRFISVKKNLHLKRVTI